MLFSARVLSKIDDEHSNITFPSKNLCSAPWVWRKVAQKRPLRALRAVARGKADAAIVGRAVVEHMGELDFASELRVIHTSKPVPPPAVVVMGEGVQHAAELKQVLVGICGRPDGVELCKSLTLKAVKAASDKDYKPLLERYKR